MTPAAEFDLAAFKERPLQKKNTGNPSTRSRVRYKDVISAFDIETTRIREIEQSVMYIWQWAFDEHVYVGRTWAEFADLAEKIAGSLGTDEKLVVFVHNLSYEFSYLKGIYDFQPEDVFAVDQRKILKCTMLGHIEFRCSYLHSNMSLKEYTDKMGAEHAKLSQYDYTKERWPWTPIEGDELLYCVYDVIGLTEAIRKDMEIEGDTLYSFPLTATGYIRRSAKKAMKGTRHNYAKLISPNRHVYTMLREAFRGGNTHASRYFSGRIVENVNQVDRSSSYPEVLVNRPYPSDTFREIGPCDNDVLRRCIDVHHRAAVFRCILRNVRLKDPTWGCPYIPKDKCRNIVKAGYDNGRVLHARELEITLTDVDYKIIREEYDFDIEVTDLAFTRYARLPKCFTDLINHLYDLKTALKGGPEETELEYWRAKVKINSLYGLTAQDPCKLPLVFNGATCEPDISVDVGEILAKDNFKRVLPPYQIGVWCTAYAREELERGMRIVHETPGAYFVYTDTDSVKYIGDVDFSAYNNEKIEMSKRSGSYATDLKGKTHYMGVFENEGTARRFKTFGAKKYAYEDENGKLHLTVAGVVKRAGAAALEKDGGLDAFDQGYIFTGEAGGLEAIYNDEAYGPYTVDGHEIYISSNVVLRESTYTLGITEEYEYLLRMSALDSDEYF